MSPKISCICLTCRTRWMLDLATKCFRNQTYPNKELVVVSDNNNKVIRGYKEDNPDVKIVLTEPGQYTIGEKRNLAVEESSGEYVATWDDDDFFHYRRLEIQHEKLKRESKHACVLTRICLYNYKTDFYWISPPRDYYNQTLLCSKKHLVPFENLDYGEDMVPLYHLVENELTSYLDNPFLYVYTYSGWNLTPMMKWKAKLFYSGTRILTTADEERTALEMMKETGGMESILKMGG